MFETAANAGNTSGRLTGGLLVAVALTEFSVHYEQTDSELAKRAWRLVADHLAKHCGGPE